MKGLNKQRNMTCTEAVGRATAKIVNPSLSRSASFALGMEVRVSAEIIEDSEEITGETGDYAKDLASKVMDFLGHRHGLRLSINNQIPEGSGLGVKEAVCVATMLATAGAISRKHGSVNELKIDKYIQDQFFVVDGKVVDKQALIELCPGEFDRLISGLYGGFAVTDNRHKKIVRRGEMESMDAVALIPTDAKETASEELMLYRNETDIIWEEASKGNMYTAMKLNSLLYRETFSRDMLKAGALAVTVTDPGVVALSRDASKTDAIADSVRDAGDVQVVPVCNTQSRVLVKPKLIYKTREFLKLKGEEQYRFM